MKKFSGRIPTSGPSLIRLSPRDLGWGVHVSTDWISNGHWAVRKSRVSNSVLFTSQAIAEAWIGRSIGMWGDLTEEKVAKVTTVGTVPFKVSPVIYEARKTVARLVIAENAHAWINDEMLKLFNVALGANLYAKDATSPMGDATGADISFVVMPMRLDDAPLFADLRTLFNESKAVAA